MVKVKSASEIPQYTKFLLIIFSTTSVFVPGDVRSRTNPGHGYPEHTDVYSTTEIYAFTEYGPLETELHRLYSQDKNRRDISVIQVSVVVPVGVSLKIDLFL